MLSYLKSVFTTVDDAADDGPTGNYEVTASIPLGKSEFESKYLSMCLNTPRPKGGTLEELLLLSEKFPATIPVKSVCCVVLKDEHDITPDILEHHANSAYPLLHEAVVSLYLDFLEYKKNRGSRVEKAMYENMGLIDFVQRLLDKRAVVFCGPSDYYVLLSGETGRGGWELVGTEKETPPLVLANCLSYDEIKLSALLALTCYSVFINDGNRYNVGEASDITEIERHGVVVGIVGSRLTAGEIMEAEEILITDTQNISKNGYGSSNKGPKHEWRQVWSKFYGVDNLPTYKEVQNLRQSRNESVLSRYVKLKQNIMFDNEIYAKRVSVAAELLLLEAESRAVTANKPAFLHVVGFGLGVWKASSHQDKIFLDIFGKCLKDLYPVLHHVSDVNFAWFREKSCGGVEDGGVIGDDSKKIQIHFSNRHPHSKLENKNKLLVVSYAWDGNSQPGNEFWTNSLNTSGDPANACSTQVAELQNSHINRKVCGANLHVATTEWGVIHISEYAHRKLMK